MDCITPCASCPTTRARAAPATDRTRTDTPCKRPFPRSSPR
jgi:hypothetical protein